MAPLDAGNRAAALPDRRRMRAYRLARLREQLEARDYAGLLLFDPVNIRYATDSPNMQVWILHNQARYAYVSTEGPVVLFDFHNCGHLSDDIETIDEVRLSVPIYYFGAGPRSQEQAGRFAAEIDALVRAHGGGNRRIAVDKLELAGAKALEALGVELFDGQEVAELARVIKSPDEIAAMREAVRVCQLGMARMHEAARPGMTENEVWSLLHQTNIANGGEWIETRLFSAGERSNPWFHECSDHVIEAGDIVSYDTDLIGPYGMCADVSRSFVCGKPNDEQRRLYGLARAQIEHNIALLRPGLGFREAAERAWQMPESCRPNRYSVVYHGVGLCDEYPAIVYQEDFGAFGYEGEFQPGMTICVESYMGELGGREGIKLEEQVLITETGIERLSTFPYENALMPSRWA